VPGRMLVDPGNVGLALDGQLTFSAGVSSIAVLWPAGGALASACGV
jgi:hypothetical protein